MQGRDVNQAAAPLQNWGRKEFESIREQLVLKAEDKELQAAAMLHLEFGAAAVEEFPEVAEWHLAIGAQLMEASTRWHKRFGLGTGEQVAIQSRWLSVAASVLLSVNDSTRARWFVTEAWRISPKSAPALTRFGVLNELEAAVPTVDLWTVNILEPQSVARWRLLRVAADSYRKATEYEPNYAPAYLRLGRALYILDRLPEAREAIERAQKLDTNPSTQYLGALTIGAILEKRKDLKGARASYDRALTLFPKSQAATVALGHLDLIEGRPDRARARTEAFLAAPLNDVDWWEFKNGGLDREGFEWLRSRARR